MVVVALPFSWWCDAPHIADIALATDHWSLRLSILGLRCIHNEPTATGRFPSPCNSRNQCEWQGRVHVAGRVS